VSYRCLQSWERRLHRYILLPFNLVGVANLGFGTWFNLYTDIKTLCESCPILIVPVLVTQAASRNTVTCHIAV
jgi:hypothetical protein